MGDGIERRRPKLLHPPPRQPARDPQRQPAALSARARDLPARPRGPSPPGPTSSPSSSARTTSAARARIDDPLDRFRADVDAALGHISTGLPDARIQVLSVPDVYRLGRFSMASSSPASRGTGSGFAACCSTMRPRHPADVARRQQVRARTVELNGVLGEVCAAYVHCRFDGGAVFRTAFGRSDVSNVDYFHPSGAGQAKLAAAAWAVTFDFRDRPRRPRPQRWRRARRRTSSASPPATMRGSRASNTGSKAGHMSASVPVVRPARPAPRLSRGRRQRQRRGLARADTGSGCSRSLGEVRPQSD